MPFLFAHGINRFSHNIAYVILVQLNLFITLFAHGINRFSHNIAYVILVQLNLFITLFVITRFWL